MRLTAAEGWPRASPPSGGELRRPAPARSGPRPPAAAGAPAPASAERDAIAELARRARAGDRAAFALLYEEYATTVHGLLLASVPAAEARDLVQDVFLLALRAIGRLEDPALFGPWLCAIAKNRARDAHKRRRDERGDLALELVADEHAGERLDLEAREALACVRELPESYRETLLLRLVEGLSGPEIAQRTGLTHGSVRVNLHRGMKLLKERLAARGWLPEGRA
jgi:RNA polymerase sigma-70 factor (ECF subfamily)